MSSTVYLTAVSANAPDKKVRKAPELRRAAMHGGREIKRHWASLAPIAKPRTPIAEAPTRKHSLKKGGIKPFPELYQQTSNSKTNASYLSSHKVCSTTPRVAPGVRGHRHPTDREALLLLLLALCRTQARTPTAPNGTLTMIISDGTNLSILPWSVDVRLSMASSFWLNHERERASETRAKGGLRKREKRTVHSRFAEYVCHPTKPYILSAPSSCSK